MVRTENEVEIELGELGSNDSLLPDEREQQQQVLKQEQQQQQQVHVLEQRPAQVLEQEESIIRKIILFLWKTYFPTRQEFDENLSMTIFFLVFLILVCSCFISSFFLHGTKRAIGYFISFGLVGIHEILSLLRFQKDLTEKGVRLRSTYLLMFLFCCVYFFFVILDALLQQCPQHSSCNCWNPLTLLSLILEDLIVAIFKLFPFVALSSLPLVLVALFHSISLLFRRKDFFENPGWVSYLTVGMMGVPMALASLFLVSSLLNVVMWVVLAFVFDICVFEDPIDYLERK